MKYRNGATTRLDVTQGESNLGQTASIIPPLEAARRQAANQLCILLGMPPHDIDAILGTQHAIPSAAPQVAVGIPADLLRRRPDVRPRNARRQPNVPASAWPPPTYTPISRSPARCTSTPRPSATCSASGSLAGSVGPSFHWNILNYGRLRE